MMVYKNLTVGPSVGMALLRRTVHMAASWNSRELTVERVD